MGTVTSYGVGRLHAAEADLSMVGRQFRAGSVPGIVLAHGSGQSTASWLNFPFIPAIGERWPIATGDMGGAQTWGNNTAISRVGEAKTWLEAGVGAVAGPVVLMGASMGALAVLNWARQHPSLVSAVVVFIPVLDLQDVWANNYNGATALINAAYGGAYVDATERAVHNPLYQSTVGDHRDYPIQIWFSDNDPVALPTFVEQFVDNVGSTATAHSMGSIGHTSDITAGDLEAIVEFIREYV